jgi:hypothetical protein
MQTPFRMRQASMRSATANIVPMFGKMPSPILPKRHYARFAARALNHQHSLFFLGRNIFS